MAEILGIVANFLELGKWIYKPIKRQLNYLCCFKNNVENLRDEARKLEDTRNQLQMRVDPEENNAQVIVPTVKAWLEDASNTQAKMFEIETEITTTQQGGFTLKPRYSLSKKLKTTAKAMKELRKSCDFSIISHPPPPPALVSVPLGSVLQFESRKNIEEEIMTSLRDDGVNTVGICGMAGVGKTTMAKTITHRVREERLFEEIVMVVVSQNADMLRIQDDIARSLSLDLGEGSLFSKAHNLRRRLTEGTKRSLIVVDDVWENLKLEELGIFCENRCKVLLTSRNSDIFKRMNVEKVHAVKVLSEIEAWRLFTSYVGSCIEHQNVMSVARQVVAECKGLPVALVTVGAALKDMENTSVWKDWLYQLKGDNPICLPEVLDDVYKPLRSSYEFLKNEQAESLFLLCCLYPEDHDIPLYELTVYATGLGMLTGIKGLEHARNRVCSLVEMLKSRFLLLEGNIKNHVAMHDVVRDVGIFIALDKKWIISDSKTNDCTWISPHVGERIEFHAGSIVFPNLHLLWIDRNSRDRDLEIDDHFFKGMKELNVLSIKCPSLRQLPHTTILLKNLQTLILDSCESLESLLVVGELVNVEILICRWCKSIESLPMEIGKLGRLRLLELSNCRNLKTIAPGIISNLKGLEELIVEGCFDGWEGKNMDEERKNASLSEVEQLSNLSRLNIEIKDSRLTAQQMLLSPNMVGYHLQIGNVPSYRGMLSYRGKLYEKKMELALPGNTRLENWIHECVRSVEYVYTEGDGSGGLDFGVAHENIRVLVIRKCSTMKKIVSMETFFPLLEVLELEHLSELEIGEIDGEMPSNCLKNLKELRLDNLPKLEHLWKSSISPYPHAIFNKLTFLFVCTCNKLQSLFLSSMMKRGSSLVQLERLEIQYCSMMEQVLLWDDDDEEGNKIPLVFPKLKLLKLNTLPRLTSFSKGIESIEFPVLEEMKVNNCPLESFVFTPSSNGSPHDDDNLFCKPDKVKFDCLSRLELNYGNHEMGRIWCPLIPLDFFTRLRELNVWRINGLKSLISSSTTTKSGSLSQLEKIETSECDMMEEVIRWNEEENQANIQITILFPKLKILRLMDLPRLMRLSKGIQFLLPVETEIFNCPLLESCVSSTSTSSNSSNDSIHLFCQTDKVELGSLKILKICKYGITWRNWCPMIDIFSGLHELHLFGIEGVKSLFSSSVARNLHKMRGLRIYSCGEMVRVIEDDDEVRIQICLLPNLKELHLCELYKLKSFCEWRCALEFPSLTTLLIKRCEMMEKFTWGPLNAPMLTDVSIDGAHSPSDEDVNTLFRARR